jgi:hypothetical protein
MSCEIRLFPDKKIPRCGSSTWSNTFCLPIVHLCSCPPPPDSDLSCPCDKTQHQARYVFTRPCYFRNRVRNRNSRYAAFSWYFQSFVRFDDFSLSCDVPSCTCQSSRCRRGGNGQTKTLWACFSLRPLICNGNCSAALRCISASTFLLLCGTIPSRRPCKSRLVRKHCFSLFITSFVSLAWFIVLLPSATGALSWWLFSLRKHRIPFA